MRVTAPAAWTDTVVSKHMQGGRAEPMGRGGNAVISLVVGGGGVLQVGCNCLSLPLPFYLQLNKNSHPPKPVSVEDNADPYLLSAEMLSPGTSRFILGRFVSLESPQLLYTSFGQ